MQNTNSNDGDDLPANSNSNATQGLGLLGDGPGMSDMMGMLRDPSGVEDMLLDPAGTGDSPAAVLADLINMMRADAARLAAEHGIDQDVKRMTPDRAAELLAGSINGDGVEIVHVFNDVADQRDAVLCDVLDDDAYDEFIAAKEASLWTTPPGDEDGETDGTE